MWSIVLMILSGLWLMSSPGILNFGETVADNAHIVGPVIAAFSIISLSDCTLRVRYANVPLAVWLLAAPWVLQYNDTAATLNDTAVGIAVLLLCLVNLKHKQRFGGGWRAVWRANSLHEKEAGNPARVRLRTDSEE